MKDILISVRPQWVEKIFHKIGEIDGKPIYKKEIEVRKDKPMQVQVPFKCLIYETYDKKYDGIGVCWEKGNTFEHACKKVIGEFVCDKVDTYCYHDFGYEISEETFNKTMLTGNEFCGYGKGKTLYGWHISDLKIYDKPKELNEFTPFCKYKDERCGYCSQYVETFGGCCKTLKRPPQSWCYVEGEK